MRLSVLTYNIHKAIGVDRRLAPWRIAEVLAHHSADVVLLQEVDRGAPRSEHLDLASYFARLLKYPYRAVGMNVHLKKGRYGNATLSRFPIGRQRNIDLTIGRRKRRAQHTHVLADNGAAPISIDVFNVHLSLIESLRRVQVRRLLDSSDVAQLPPDAPCIVAGDMNDWRGTLRRPLFGRAGFLCATDHRPGSHWQIRTFPSFAPTGGLDKIFFRGPLKLIHAYRSRLRVARVASDHLPVIAEFEIYPRALPGAAGTA